MLSSLQKYSNVIEGVAETVNTLRSSPYNLRIGSTTGYPTNVLNVLLNASRGQGGRPFASFPTQKLIISDHSRIHSRRLRLSERCAGSQTVSLHALDLCNTSGRSAHSIDREGQ